MCCFNIPQTTTAGCGRKFYRADQKQHYIPKVQHSQASKMFMNVKAACVRPVQHVKIYSFNVSIYQMPVLTSSRRNILPHINSSYLKRCEFSRTTDPHCPIFRLKNIVSEAGEDFQDMAVKVTLLIILFTQLANLDFVL